MGNNPTVAAIIPARLDSSRLPKKHFRDLCGHPMIWFLIQRMKAVDNLDHLVVATTNRSIDDELAEWATRKNLDIFRGSTEDVLGRITATAEDYQADLVIRANGDNPLLAPEVTASGIRFMQEHNLDFATGKCKYTNLPVGIGAEFLQLSTLQKLDLIVDQCHHREHVTTYIFDNPEQFHWDSIEIRPSWEGPDHRLTVDTIEDLEYLRQIIGLLPGNDPQDWSVEDIIGVCNSIYSNEHTNQ